jgi:threonine/homoserine/homoserine lactone efflux protein
MTGIIHFETFLLTGILLNLTPGNDTIFILSRSMAQGKKTGFVSVLGIATGLLTHTTLAAFGLWLIITKSIILFNIIKYAGAVYIVYIGCKMLMEKRALATSLSPVHAFNPWTVYRDAYITNVLNPKVALFFIAFLPQFIDTAYRHAIIPFLILGTTFTITGTLWCSLLVIFSSAIASSVKENNGLSVYINKICGAALIALGIKIAFTK